MNLIRKTAIPFILFTSLILTGCGNGLKNEKEVDLVEFTAAAIGTVDSNTYSYATAKTEYCVFNGETTTINKSEKEFVWDIPTGLWRANEGTIGEITIDHITTDVHTLLKNYEKYGLTPTTHYYLADNGFRVTIKEEGTIPDAVNITIEAEAIYNQFGYPTRKFIKEKTQVYVDSKTIETWASQELKISYK